jgi:predicted nucleic acid-binding protein
MLGHDEALHLVSEMLRLPLRVSMMQRQFTHALELANRFRRSKAYDMQYLAVAELEDCEIVTLDGGIRQAAIELKRPYRLLR